VVEAHRLKNLAQTMGSRRLLHGLRPARHGRERNEIPTLAGINGWLCHENPLEVHHWPIASF